MQISNGMLVTNEYNQSRNYSCSLQWSITKRKDRYVQHKSHEKYLWTVYLPSKLTLQFDHLFIR